ncbi:MAG: hypothetical protein JST16_15330 [Bdellovibrionales bacterium]|nr:hypothetical protein [Bdellovibrionales bacterium]
MVQRHWLSHISQWSGSGLLSVLGATGSGKTRTVLDYVRTHYAQRLREPLLVSVDSIAMYRELDIGSAKPLGAERSDFDWVGLDLFAPSQQVTASDFIRQVLPTIENALAHRRPVICVGGSHFYERALVQGMAPGEASDPVFVATLEGVSNAELHRRLSAQDARWVEKIHPNDRYRLTRYLDLTERQGLSYEALVLGQGPARRSWTEVDCLAVGEGSASENVRSALRSRIQAMLEQDWVAEVRALLAQYGEGSPALESVGYRQIVEGLQNKFPWEQLEEQILIAHLQLAKKQRTWLRGLRKGAESTDV